MNKYLRMLRPHQWLKNLVLFFPPFLGGVFVKPELSLSGIIPFIAFCSAASSAYIANDLYDSQVDKFHLRKKLRPIVNNEITHSSAKFILAILLLLSLYLAFLVSVNFLTYLFIYLLITFLYSAKLKNIPIIDIFCIASGFIIRLEAGGVAFGVIVSEWLFLTVFLLALFLSIGKRRCEKLELGSQAGEHRTALEHYPDSFLDMALAFVGSAALVVYTIYSLKRGMLVYSVPVCTFGLLRYMLCVKTGVCGDPTEALIRDKPLLMTSIFWVVMVALSVYG